MKPSDRLLSRAAEVLRECRLSRRDARRAMRDVRAWVAALRRSGVPDSRIVVSVETDRAGWARVLVGQVEGVPAASAPSSQAVH